MAKGKIPKVYMNELMLLCGGPVEYDLDDCITSGRQKQLDFKVRLLDKSRVNISLMVTKVVKDPMNENSYSFFGVSEYINGEYDGYYDVGNSEGRLVRHYNKGHN